MHVSIIGFQRSPGHGDTAGVRQGRSRFNHSHTVTDSEGGTAVASLTTAANHTCRRKHFEYLITKGYNLSDMRWWSGQLRHRFTGVWQRWALALNHFTTKHFLNWVKALNFWPTNCTSMSTFTFLSEKRQQSWARPHTSFHPLGGVNCWGLSGGLTAADTVSLLEEW